MWRAVHLLVYIGAFAGLLLICLLNRIYLPSGFILRSYQLSDDTIMLISYPGELFLRMLKLITLPMLISSLITVTANLNVRTNGKIVLRTLIYFASTSMVSAFCGICLAMLLQPGSSVDAKAAVQGGQKTKFLDSMLDLGR